MSASDDDGAKEPVSLLEARAAARKRGEEKGEMMRAYLSTSTTGMEVGVGVALGALGGWWLDGKYGTAPWGMLVGLTLGVLHATRRLVGLVRRELARSDDESADSTGGDDAPSVKD